MFVRRYVLSFGLAALMAFAVASPSFAYGKENYQVTFSGTGVTPSTIGLGFWGWCAFGQATAASPSGVPTAGNDGDCEFAEYVHTPGGSGWTCHVSLNLDQWNIGSNGDFFFSGTAAVSTGSLTPQEVGACLGFAGLPGPTFSGADSLLPAAVGHHNFGNIFGTTTGSFQEQVSLIP